MRMMSPACSAIRIALFFLAAFPPLAADASVPITTLHSFSGGNGDHPWTLLKGGDGSFYGTSLGTGTTNGGTVFKIGPTGLLTVLYTFEPLGSTPPYANTHGATPYGSLLQGPDGNFYGATGLGGVNGSGTIFKIAPDGYLTTLYAFAPLDASGKNSHGAYPVSALAAGRDGEFYGSTAYGGTSGNGTLFKITSGGALTTLYTFDPLNSDNTNSHGAFPKSPLTPGADGNFYSVTRSGGTSGMGTVFQLTPSGAIKTLYSFDPLGPGNINSHGAQPMGGLVETGGDFAGTTFTGGTSGTGTVFRITTGGDLTTLYTFDPGETNGIDSHGTYPAAGLAADAAGNLYGTTSGGGTSGQGTVFALSPAGAIATLYCFAPTSLKNSHGAGPESGVTLGPDGEIYGTTYWGGLYGEGTIFRFPALAPGAFPPGD